jgi:hypothetical protein
MMDGVILWCRIAIVDRDGVEQIRCTLEGAWAPDLRVVDLVASWALLARRLDGVLVLRDVEPDLCELLELVGLPVEVERQVEGREQSLRIHQGQKEAHLDDLP